MTWILCALNLLWFVNVVYSEKWFFNQESLWYHPKLIEDEQGNLVVDYKTWKRFKIFLALNMGMAACLVVLTFNKILTR